MTAEQFRIAFTIAKADVTIDSVKHTLIPFDGFGMLDFEPVSVTIEQVASLMRYQAQMINGAWDQEELESIKFYGKKRFLIKG
jgi:hypothetical protein